MKLIICCLIVLAATAACQSPFGFETTNTNTTSVCGGVKCPPSEKQE